MLTGRSTRQGLPRRGESRRPGAPSRPAPPLGDGHRRLLRPSRRTEHQPWAPCVRLPEPEKQEDTYLLGPGCCVGRTGRCVGRTGRWRQPSPGEPRVRSRRREPRASAGGGGRRSSLRAVGETTKTWGRAQGPGAPARGWGFWELEKPPWNLPRL